MNWYLILVFTAQYVISNGQRMPEERIVNGQFASQNQFPWMAAVYRKALDYSTMRPIARSHFIHCGGTIISEMIILTAAHCIFETNYSTKPPRTIYRYEPDDLGVVVGTINLRGKDYSHTLRVERVLVYEHYNVESLQNDVALIKLRRRLKFINGQIEPIVLERRWVNIPSMATVAGWGNTCKGHPNVTSELDLMFADVQVLEVGNCRDVYITQRLIPNTILCVGPGLRVHKGDSGGGLWVKNYNNKPSLIGIVSITEDCPTRNPAIFVNVPTFYSWIMNNANSLMGLEHYN